jgi:hypothetical protein
MRCRRFYQQLALELSPPDESSGDEQADSELEATALREAPLPTHCMLKSTPPSCENLGGHRVIGPTS